MDYFSRLMKQTGIKVHSGGFGKPPDSDAVIEGIAETEFVDGTKEDVSEVSESIELGEKTEPEPTHDEKQSDNIRLREEEAEKESEIESDFQATDVDFAQTSPVRQAVDIVGDSEIPVEQVDTPAIRVEEQTPGEVSEIEETISTPSTSRKTTRIDRKKEIVRTDLFDDSDAKRTISEATMEPHMIRRYEEGTMQEERASLKEVLDWIHDEPKDEIDLSQQAAHRQSEDVRIAERREYLTSEHLPVDPQEEATSRELAAEHPQITIGSITLTVEETLAEESSSKHRNYRDKTQRETRPISRLSRYYIKK